MVGAERQQELADLRFLIEKLRVATQHLDAAIGALEAGAADDALRILRSLYERWIALHVAHLGGRVQC